MTNIQVISQFLLFKTLINSILSFIVVFYNKSEERGGIMNKIHVSLGKYIQGPNLIRSLSDYSKEIGKKGVYAIVDTFVLETYREELESSYKDDNHTIELFEFGGEC